MVRPARFQFNSETAADNHFQKDSDEIASHQALLQFDSMVKGLRKAGIDVLVIDDTPEPIKPDAVFPNNWISFHPDGRIFLFPMKAKNRRIERRRDIVDQVRNDFMVEDVIDLSEFEHANQFLEGTGSMVLDHRSKKVYACISERTNPILLSKFADIVGYEPVVFHARDAAGEPIYHTNVLMCIGDGFATICLEALGEDKELVLRKLKSSGLDIMEITLMQMGQFAGNMLHLGTNNNESVIVMSSNAFESLNRKQLDALGKHGKPLHFQLDVLETNGGSARCMIAEIFLTNGR